MKKFMHIIPGEEFKIVFAVLRYLQLAHEQNAASVHSTPLSFARQTE